MAIEVFNRYENKYMLSKETFEKFIPVISRYMTCDTHNISGNTYTISNIYYDTDDDYLIRTSISKPKYKEKLRLRAYGVPELSSKVFLEIKKKYKGKVNKRRTGLTLGEAYEFLSTGRAPNPKGYMNKQVLREIEYFLEVYNPKPKAYIAYDRIAFFAKDNPDLRVSFDTNIRTRRYDLDLSKGDYGEKLLDEDIYLMEIKTYLAMPVWLADALAKFNIKPKSFSKYGTEYKKHINSSLHNAI